MLLCRSQSQFEGYCPATHLLRKDRFVPDSFLVFDILFELDFHLCAPFAFDATQAIGGYVMHASLTLDVLNQFFQTLSRCNFKKVKNTAVKLIVANVKGTSTYYPFPPKSLKFKLSIGLQCYFPHFIHCCGHRHSQKSDNNIVYGTCGFLGGTAKITVAIHISDGIAHTDSFIPVN